MKIQLQVLAVVACVGVSQAQAELAHRYSFNDGTANDSVGSADGTLIGTNGSIAGGELVLANTGESSADPGAAGAYLDLPNGLTSSTAAGGVGGALTVEMWLTMTENRDWAAAFSAGSSVNGEDTSDCCNGDEPYIQIIPRTGDGGQGNDVRVTTNSTGAGEGFVDDLGVGDGTDLQVGVQEHLVSVFDQSAGTPGSVTVYRNGVLMGSEAISANLDLNTFLRGDNTGGDFNVWVGRSQWPDSLVAANVNELRLYDHALSASQAAINSAAGPDVVVPEPTTITLLLAASGIALFRRRSHN